MTWHRYDLVFRLLSPLHVGYRKTGNLMQTRRYLPGKNLWAALTARLTRDHVPGATYHAYQCIGDMLKTHFRFTYLYPALPQNSTQNVTSTADVTVCYPWHDPELFDYRLLSSYAGTALNYDRQAAEDSLLHEVEFIRSYAEPVDDGEPLPVYLAGAVYTQAELPNELNSWKEALQRIELGGERKYGWGRVRLASPLDRWHEQVDEPSVSCQTDDAVQAHVHTHGADLVGRVEPLVGWERNNTDTGSNWRLSPATICFVPGSVVKRVAQPLTFEIGAFGIWQQVNNVGNEQKAP
ncbi:MAG: hypothetical protein ACLFVO_00080 [Chloroflexaceae bacterium]